VDTTSSIQSVTQTYTDSSASTMETASSQDLATQEVFIELLTAQLQYQDPLDPADNQEFVSQLSQLSTVEQLRTANANLETLQLYEMSINNAQAVSMIGKSIKASGDVTVMDSSGRADVSFCLDNDAAVARITIYDSDSGNAVRTFEAYELEAGNQVVTWDGENNDGSPLPEGEYTFSVTAEDTDGNTVGVETFISGVVEGISFENGIPLLHVGNQKVTMGEIFEVMQE